VYAEFYTPSVMIPTVQPETLLSPATGVESQLAALLTSAAIAPLAGTGWIRATGEDRVRWLNGMVTNSVQELQPGEGNYNFILNAQGRIQGDATIFATTDSLILETGVEQVPKLIALLDRFIIMDDVELTDVTSTRAGLLIAGPEAPGLLDQLSLPATGLKPLQLKALTWQAGEVTLLHAHSPLVPRFELWADPTTIAAVTSALHAAGAVVAAEPAIEQLRILEGTPRYGIDIRDRELPQETAQTRALHFSKGCYLGQEIVERIRSRGAVHRTFSAFRLEGTMPPAGTALEADSKAVGELTSVAHIKLPTGPLQLALGYVRREALETSAARNLPITYAGGIAVSVPVPFAVPAAG
jgi:folate-binding protein YgfZ